MLNSKVRMEDAKQDRIIACSVKLRIFRDQFPIALINFVMSSSTTRIATSMSGLHENKLR